LLQNEQDWNMSIITYLKRQIAVFLLLMVVLTMVNSFAMAKATPLAMGANLSGTAFHSEPFEADSPDMSDFKPPKNSFIDYDMFFSCSACSPQTRTADTQSVTDPDSRTIPGAWPEILVPPKI
jgi:hypothetical protein